MASSKRFGKLFRGDRPRAGNEWRGGVPNRKVLRHTLLEPLERREMLTVTLGDLTEQEVALSGAGTSVDARRAQSVAVDNDGDFAVAYTRSEVLRNPITGGFVFDTNVYARYYTDEVQRITLPGNAVGGTFSLVVGDEIEQRLRITGDVEQPYGGVGGFGQIVPPVSDIVGVNPAPAQPLSGSFVLGYDVDGDGFIGDEEQVEVQYGSLVSLVNGLRSLGGPLAQVDVVRVHDGDFRITLPAARNEAGQLRGIAVMDDTGLSGGFFPHADISTTWAPPRLFDPLFTSSGIRLFNDPDPARVASVTSDLIELSFANSSRAFTVHVTGRYRQATDTYEFDIHFVDRWGKQDLPEIIIESVTDAIGNSLGSSADNLSDIRVETLKEPSPELRVNNEEGFDPITGRFLGGDQGAASIAMDADGDFIVVWGSEVSDTVNPGSQEDIFARRFNSVGAPLGGQFRVNEVTRNRQFNPAVAMDDAGNFVVTWMDEGQSSSFFNNVVAKRFDLDGNALGSTFSVSGEFAQEDDEPDVGMSPDGHFAIVWSDNLGAYNIRGRVYMPDGTLLHDYSPAANAFIDSVPFGTNPTQDINTQPVVALDAANRFTVAWTTSIDADPGMPEADNSLGNNNRSVGVRAIQFAADGTVLLDRFRANTADLNEGSNPEIGLDQFSPALASDEDGDYVVGWEGFGFDLDGSLTFGTGTLPGVITTVDSRPLRAAGALGPDVDSFIRRDLLPSIRQNSTSEQQLLTFIQGQSAPTGTFNIVFGGYQSGPLPYQLGQIQTFELITDPEFANGLEGAFDIIWGFDEMGMPIQGTLSVAVPDPMDPMALTQAQQIEMQLLQLLPQLGSNLVVPGLPLDTPDVQVQVMVAAGDMNGDGVEDYTITVTFIGTALLVQWPEINMIPGLTGDGTPIATVTSAVAEPIPVIIQEELQNLLVRGHVVGSYVVQTDENGNESLFGNLNGDAIPDFQLRFSWIDSVTGLDFPLVELVAGFDDDDGQRLGRFEEQIVQIFPEASPLTGKYALRFQRDPEGGSPVLTFSPFEYTTVTDLIEQIEIVLNSATGGAVVVAETPNSGTDIDGDGVSDIELKIVYAGNTNARRNVGNLEILPAADIDGNPLPDALNAFTQTTEIVRGSTGATVNVRFESLEEVKGFLQTLDVRAQRQESEDFLGISRGEPNGTWFSTFDADPNLSPPADRPGIIVEENLGTRTDGVNSQYVMAFSVESAIPAVEAVTNDPVIREGFLRRTQLTGTFGLRITGVGQTVDLDIDFPAVFGDFADPFPVRLVEAIETAFEGTGLFGTIDPNDDIPFGVWVRIIPASEIRARVGTPYEITFSGAAGPVSTDGRHFSNAEFYDVAAVEITFIEAFHDRGGLNVSLRTIDALDLELFQPNAGGGGGGGGDPDPNDQEEPEYDDIPGIMTLLQEQVAEPGAEQKRVSVAMEPDGDFVSVWVDAGERLSRADLLVVDTYGDLLNTEGFGESNRPPSIVFQRFNETTDTVGPRLTEFALPSGSTINRVRNNGIIDVPTNLLIASFDEDMSTTGIGSVTNPANWEVIRDGIRIPNTVTKVEYGLNLASDLGLGPRTNKYEAVIYFDGNGPFAGTPELPNGSYQIVASNRLRDVAGNPLNSNGFRPNGATSSRNFGVSVVGGSERRVNADPIGTQTTAGRFESPQAVASDADGDYVGVFTALPGDAQGRVGIYASLFRGRNDGQQSEKFAEIRVTDDPTAQYAAVAKDGDGDFVVTWMQFSPSGLESWDVYARRFDALGNALGAAFRVNTETESTQGFAAVAMDLDGDFVVTWQSLGQEDDRTTYGVFAQRYNSLGEPVGGQNETQQIQIDGRPSGGTFALNFEGARTATITFSRNPSETAANIEAALEALEAIGDVSVTPLGTGRFNVVFLGQAGQQELSLLVPVEVDIVPPSVMQVTRVQEGRGGEFRVNVTEDGDQTMPAIGMDADGDFVISWTGSGQNGDALFETNVYARRFSRNEVAFPNSRGGSSISIEDVALMEGTQVRPWLVTTDNPNNHIADPTFGSLTAFSGVGALFIDGGLCTGTLLPTGRHVLTAAHCVTNAAGVPTATVIDAVFQGDPLGVGQVTVPGSRVFVHPGYDGNFFAGNDIAIIELAFEAPEGIDRHDIYRSTDEVGQRFVKVGYGTTGTGATGGVGIDLNKRFGENRYDVPGEDFNGTVVRDGTVIPGSQLIFDFDNGLLANDAAGVLFNRIDVGLGLAEVSTAPGDSGGPGFIGDLIASVTSYGVAIPSIGTDVIPGVNASFGEFAGDARVSTYASWIDSVTGGAGQGGSVSGEFLVNTTTSSDQGQSTVAMDADGDFVIAWASYGSDGGGNGYGPGSGGTWGVFAQRFDEAANRVGSEFRVNTTIDRDQQSPKVKMDADGDFLIAWESFQERDPGGVDPANFGIYGKRFVRNEVLGTGAAFGPNGEIGGEIKWNSTVAGDQRFPSVALNNEGDMVVMWSGQGANDDNGVFHSTLRASFDVAGPMVTDVLAPLPTGGFQRVTADSAIKVLPSGATNRLLVVFGEEVNTASVGGFNSVTNPNNWQLLLDGGVLAGGVVSVEFGLNLMASKGGTPTDKFEALVTLDGEPQTPGIQPLARNQYTLVALDRIEDLEENALDGNLDGLPGGDFRLNFSVAREASTGGGGGDDSGSDGTPPNPPGDPSQDPKIIRPTDELRLNTDTFGVNQVAPAVAMNNAGDFVSVWVSDWPVPVGGAFVTEPRVVGRMYNNFGEPMQLLEFGIASSQVSNFLVGEQRNPDVAMDELGGFVVVWEEIATGNETDTHGIWGRVFDFTGQAVSDRFLVNQFTTGVQSDPSVAVDPSGGFVVSWTSFGQDGDLDGVFARRFDAFGDPLGGEFQVNTRSAERQDRSDVAIDSDGDFVIVWNSYGQDGSSWGVYGQRFNANGTRRGGEFRVNDTTANQQRLPKVAMDADGEFAVTWQSFSANVNGYDVYAKRYNAAGTSLGGEFRVNQTTAAYQHSPDVAMSKDGKAYFTWTSANQDGSVQGVMARLYGNEFEGLGEFRVNRTTLGDQNSSAIAADEDGDLVVVWQGPGTATTGTDIFARYMLVNEPAQSTIDVSSGGAVGNVGGGNGGGGGGGGGGGAGTWHHAALPEDVNSDGSVNALDVLLIINRINSGEQGQLPAPPPLGTVGHHFVDVNNDGRLTSLDALRVVNYINAGSSASAKLAATGAGSREVIPAGFVFADSSGAGGQPFGGSDDGLDLLVAQQVRQAADVTEEAFGQTDEEEAMASRRLAIAAAASAISVDQLEDDVWGLVGDLEDWA